MLSGQAFSQSHDGAATATCCSPPPPPTTVWTASGGGSFTAAGNWSGNIAPGATSAVLIGTANQSLSGAITTSGSLSVQSLLLVGQNDSLVVSGSLGVGTGPLEQGGGTIEVTGGSTLGVTVLSQIGGGALQLDSGAHLNVTGHANLGFANAGTLTGSKFGDPARAAAG